MLLRYAQVPIICAVALAASAAHAATWYLLDYRDDRCLSGEEVAHITNSDITSPAQMIDSLRAGGGVPSVLVNRDAAGKIVEVDIGSRGGVQNSWFTSMEMCLKGKANEERKGVLTPPSELR